MPPSGVEPTNIDIARHQIAVVAERTGLSPDVLRVWERRYAAVNPVRTPGGQRLYSDKDVARFRLLAAATRRGRNISLVARLPLDELAQLVADDEQSRPVEDSAAAAQASHERVDAALAHVRELDGPGLDRVLRLTIARLGLSTFVEAVVPPLMRRIGDEWSEGRIGVAHEHLASAAVLAIIFESINAIPHDPSAPVLLVTTPSGERHAVGAALAAIGAAVDGWRVVYLGVDLPAADILTAATKSAARAVALSVVYPEDLGFVSHELRALRERLAADVPLFVGGVAATKIASELRQVGVVVCDSIPVMRAELSRVAAWAGAPTLALHFDSER